MIPNVLLEARDLKDKVACGEKNQPSLSDGEEATSFRRI